jgi:hypothetical protein
MGKWRNGTENMDEAANAIETVKKLQNDLAVSMTDPDDLRNFKGMTLAQANSAKYQLVKNSWESMKKKVSEIKNTTLRYFLEREYLDKVKSTVKVYLGSKMGELLNGLEISIASLYSKLKSSYKQRKDLMAEVNYARSI